jgi:hypothetical protein
MKKQTTVRQENPMLKILTGLIICVALVSPIQAANVITFGTDFFVIFPHVEHQKILGGCTECHGTKEPGPIAKSGKDWAHVTCIGCHRENNAGPVECSGCHNQL